jgi:hypothetical protein
VVLSLLYLGIGEYFQTKRKDELDRMIKFEASFIAMQIMPALIFLLFSIELFYHVQISWPYFMVGFAFIHMLIQAIINKRYE